MFLVYTFFNKSFGIKFALRLKRKKPKQGGIMRFKQFLILFFMPFFTLLYSQNISPDMDKILKNEKLVVGILDKDFPPFFSVNAQGELVGSDIDLAKEIGKKLGVEVVFDREAKSHDEVIDRVSKHKVDIGLSELSRTLERAKYVSFSNPYLIMSKGLLINMKYKTNGKDVIKSFNNPEMTIGLIGNSAYVKYGEELFPQAKKTFYASWNEAEEAVIQGEVGAVLVDEIILRSFPKRHPDLSTQIQTALLVENKDSLSVALAWDSNHLLYWINLFLEQRGKLQSVNEIIRAQSGASTIISK